MTTRDLDVELDRAQRALTTEHHKQLTALGIPFPIVWAGLVGVEHVTLSADGRRYWPSPDGAETFVVPARIGEYPCSPESVDFRLVPQYGGLVDLLAWSPRFPSKWALRCGLADWVGSIEPQLMSPAPVRIRRNVLDWLRHDATGLVVLVHDPLSMYRVLSVCHEIEAEDFAHARELRRVIEHPFPVPKVAVRAPERRAA